MQYQVCQVNEKLEDVVFHDEMSWKAAYSLKCRLVANEKKFPAGWEYHIERVEP